MQIDLRHLIELDDPRHAEAPAGFSYAEAEARFRQLVEALICKFSGLTYACGLMIQDASFHGHAAIPKEGTFAVVRTSNFGRLAALFDEDSCLAEDVVEFVRSMLQRFGYVLVEASLLDQKYEGQNRGVTGFRSWRERFFDYT